MFRKLRVRLTFINIGIIAALFILLTGGTYLFSSIEMQNRSMLLVQRIADEITTGIISDLPPPHRRQPPPGIHPPPGDPPPLPLVFFIKIAPSGAVTSMSSSSPLNTEEAIRLAARTLSISEPAGTIKFDQASYYFARSQLPSGEQLLVFHEPKQHKDMLQVLLMALAITGVVCLILSFFGSLYMANRAMIPIEEAWQQQKDFLADASHELRTPLTVIQTNLEVVRSNYDETVADQEQWLDNIQEELRHMTKLVDSLLFLARADTQQLIVENMCFPLHTAVLQAVKPFHPIADMGGVAVRMFLDPIMYYGDEAKIKQIVSILLDNALRYTPCGGCITVQLHQLQQTARLDIIDSGCGISPEDLEKIFDRFYQVDASRAAEKGNKGAGLGLAIAKCLAECQHGRIAVTSSPGEGCTFSVFLPIVKENC